MRVLLDTNVFLWTQDRPERLGSSLELLADIDNDLMVSAVTSWEVAIKAGLGKLTLPLPVRDYVPKRALSLAAELLPIRHDHAARVAELPPVHRDPFDRLLVAQALEESAILLTTNAQLSAYGDVVRVVDS